MCNGYFEIRLVRVKKQKGENKNTNPKPINSNKNMESRGWGVWWVVVVQLQIYGNTLANLGPGREGLANSHSN